MTRKYLAAASGSLLGTLLVLSACSTKAGTFTSHSNFAYPNSNIHELGPAHGEKTISSWFVPPIVSLEDVLEAKQQALDTYANANILINYTEDVEWTNYVLLPYYEVTYIIDGTAANMSIGDQDLK